MEAENSARPKALAAYFGVECRSKAVDVGPENMHSMSMLICNCGFSFGGLRQ